MTAHSFGKENGCISAEDKGVFDALFRPTNKKLVSKPQPVWEEKPAKTVSEALTKKFLESFSGK